MTIKKTTSMDKFLDENYRVVSWELDTFKEHAQAILDYPHSAELYVEFIIKLANQIQNKQWSGQRTLRPIIREDWDVGLW